MAIEEQQMGAMFPKMGKGLKIALAVLSGLWLAFAVAIGWLREGTKVFELLTGGDEIWQFQVWRLFTNIFIHKPSGTGSFGHIMTTVLGLYFLGSSLEERWGTKRFLMFLVGAGWFASLLQFLVGSLIPQLHQPVYFGALGVVDAIAIAWAMTFKNRQVRLFFVLPVTGRMLMFFVVGLNIFYVIALDARNPEGFITPFGGMLAGYLFGDGSPARTAYLRWKLGRMQGQAKKLQRGREGAIPGLRVIEGGASRGGKPDKDMLN